jgi:hypothetical protein
LLSLLSIVLAMGAHGGLYRLAFDLVPGIKVFHDPARLLIAAAIAIPVLAAIGLQRVLDSRFFWAASPSKIALSGATLLLLTCLDLGQFVRNVYPLKPVQELAFASHSSTLIRALQADSDIRTAQARVLFLDPQHNLSALLSYRDYMQRDPRQMQRWVETFPPNLPMTLGFLQAGGYDPVRMRRHRESLNAASNSLPIKGNAGTRHTTSSEYSSLLGNMSVKYLVTLTAQPVHPTKGLTPFWTSTWQKNGWRVRVYRNNSFVARVQSPELQPVLWREVSPNQRDVQLTATLAAQDLIIGIHLIRPGRLTSIKSACHCLELPMGIKSSGLRHTPARVSFR